MPNYTLPLPFRWVNKFLILKIYSLQKGCFLCCTFAMFHFTLKKFEASWHSNAMRSNWIQLEECLLCFGPSSESHVDCPLRCDVSTCALLNFTRACLPNTLQLSSMSCRDTQCWRWMSCLIRKFWIFSICKLKIFLIYKLCIFLFCKWGIALFAIGGFLHETPRFQTHALWDETRST